MKKKIIFAIIIFSLINLFGFIVSNTYFAGKLNYPKILGKPIYHSKSLKIYIPNKKWKVVKEKVPNLSKNMKDIQIIFLIASVLGAGFILMMKKKITHGSAQWARSSNLRQSSKKSKKPFDLDLLKDSGVVLGRFLDNSSKVLYDNYSNTHNMVIAPTRSGKAGIVSTTAVSWMGSMIVLDIKGEIFEHSAGYRAEKLDNIVLKFEPMVEDSIKINPLAEIRYMTEYEIEDARRIADMIVKDPKDKAKGDGKFWETSAAGVLTAMIIYVLYKKNGKGCLGDVVDFITDTSGKLVDRMQEAIYEPVIYSQIMLEKLSKLYINDIEIVKEGVHPFVARSFARAVQNPDKTFEGIIESLRTSLLIFELPMIKKNTSSSDFRLWDLMNLDKPVTLYLRVDMGDISMLEPLIRIIVSQTIKVLTPRMTNKKVHKHKMLYLLDEFSQLGNMQEIENSISYVSGYGIKYLLIFQGLDQMYKNYTKENALISNCQIQLYFTPTENTTAKYISEALGKKTIKNTNVNSNNLLNRSVNNTDIGRELLTIDEVLQYPVDQGLLKITGKPVIKTKKIYYWEDKKFKDKIGTIPPPETDEEIKKLKEVKYGKIKKE